MFQKQPMMRKMLYSLLPIFIYSTYLYGWRVVALTVVIFLLGIAAEYIFEKKKNKKVSEAVLVTCALYTLSLPPLVPFWMAGLGIIFAIVFAKEVYGGFGRNIFNPAIAGRLFIYITFPTTMTQGWLTPGKFGTIDTVTTATPIELMKTGNNINLFDQFIGFRSGSIGESAIILIILAAIYLMWTKTANWRIILSTLVSAVLTILLINYVDANIESPLLPSLMSGSILFVVVFIATDPISAPRNAKSLYVYGTIIGVVAIVVRCYSLFPEGTSFGILMGNTFAALLDTVFVKKKKVAK